MLKFSVIFVVAVIAVMAGCAISLTIELDKSKGSEYLEEVSKIIMIICKNQNLPLTYVLQS